MEHQAAVIKKDSGSSPISSGLVYIFVHEDFEHYESRHGAQTDVLHIRKCFELLGLTVMDPYINYAAFQVLNVLDQASRSDFSEYECFIVIIITHFYKLGQLLSKQGNYHEDEVIEFFKGNTCPGLVGKPKMFFFQASKYQDRTQETKLFQTCTDGSFIAKVTLPNEADIFTFRSSYEAGPIHKPDTRGSWVIKQLCQRLENLDGTVPLLEAITDLLNDIKSNRIGGPSLDPYTILPEMTSSLLQNVYFKNTNPACVFGSPSTYEKRKKMGRFYVFNYNQVRDPSTRGFLPRDGTEKDTAYIENCFTNLGFEVKIEDDLCKDDLLKILKEAPDFTDDTCVAVAVLTHGIDGLLGTFDWPFSEQDLFSLFAFNKRPDLIGKPKLFFLQVCRGDKITAASTVEYRRHERITEVDMSGGEITVDSTIETKLNIETEFKTHVNMEGLEVACDVNSDFAILDNDYFTTVSDSTGITTVHDVDEITYASNTRDGVTITRDVKTDTTVSDIDGNITVETMESLAIIDNEEYIDDSKSSIDTSCTTRVSDLKGVTTFFNEKVFTDVSNTDDVTPIEDLKHLSTDNDTTYYAPNNTSRLVETDARRAVQIVESTIPNIFPLEDDDTLVVHSTYANTPSHRDTVSGSWFIQDLCKHLELLTKNQEISLLDGISKVQKYIAENREATILDKLHKQMPVISSTLTRSLMLGPSTKPNTSIILNH